MWRANRRTEGLQSIFIHVLGVGNRIVAQRDTFPGHGLLPTDDISEGYTWVEQHLIDLPTLAYAPDELGVAVGLYETDTGRRLPVSGSAADGFAIAAEGDAVQFGTAALLPAAQGTPELSPLLRFGDGIALDTYDVSALVLQPGQETVVTLAWRCTAPVDEAWTVSVQLIDDQWRKAAQSDAWPNNGETPTNTWRVGEEVVERRTLITGTDTPPGSYNLRLALYRPLEDGELVHLPASESREDMPARDVVLTTVRVAEQDASW
jgi:hypothetical protein